MKIKNLLAVIGASAAIFTAAPALADIATVGVYDEDDVNNNFVDGVAGGSQTPATLWEKEVLLMRQTIELPPVRKDHLYRIVLGGAGCERSGEGFAIYLNGKPLSMTKMGFYKYPGVRGAFLYKDMLRELEKGKVTLAVINFLRYTQNSGRAVVGGQPVPPNGQVSVWLEAAKIPPAVLEATARTGSQEPADAR